MLLKNAKLPRPGSPEWRQMEANSAIAAATAVNDYGKAAPDAILALRFGREGDVLSKLETLQGQQEYLGGSINTIRYAAEGGMIEEDMPVGDMSLLIPDPMPIELENGATDSTLGYLDGLRDILGEEDFMQLESAMGDYPIVETVARMAVKTNDGEVEGVGGPKDDMVPARLSPGEFVFSKEAVDVIGVSNLEAMHEEAKQEAAMQGI